ncbi:MAG: FHA domain-containing protein [Actinomycetota bacterium]|nr:FHA domain-containing protein [Actinomycetota bacterium]
MAYVFCNQCGHRNPPTSSFCSACGAVLDSIDDHTVTIARSDPLQDATGTQDDIVVNLNELPSTASLVVRNGPQAGVALALDAAVTSLGRHEDCEISLDDITVSRHHADIVRIGTTFMVRDGGSLNGTYVNNVRIDEAPLRQGDELQVGKFRLVFFEKANG